MVEKWLVGLLKRFGRIQVYALVGPSGTGKSFRARQLAHNLGVSLFVDDGLLIHHDRVVAGRSAKAEGNYLKATKTAVFEDLDHRNALVHALAHRSFRRILLLGTSEKMVRLIARRLDLPPVHRFIRIEDIASPEEIALAQRERSLGHHVVPLPPGEVRRHLDPHFLQALRIFLERRWPWGPHRSVEKTLVKPEFHTQAQIPGGVSLTKEALIQIVFHRVDEICPEFSIKRVQVSGSLKKSFKISLFLSVNYGVELVENLHRLQDQILVHVRSYTGAALEEVIITLVQVS